MAEEACQAWFYQLERSTLDAVLPELLEKTMARGWRALVVARSKEVLDHLDPWLWIYRDDSFLAHGAAGEPGASRQPILLSLAVQNANQAQALFLVDGAEAEDISAFARCVTIFDGRDEAALARARRAWTGFRKAGHGVSYWRGRKERMGKAVVKRVLSIGLLLGLAACTASPAPRPVVAAPQPYAAGVPPPAPAASPTVDRCGAAALQYLVGRPRTEIPIPLEPSRRRVLCSACPVDRGFNPYRQTIIYDQRTDLVLSVTCE